MNSIDKKHRHESPNQEGQSKESQLTLELLQAIESRDDVSQRYLAEQMGVALGLANSYLKRCVKKGWIKMSTAPANRYLYYLTPMGLSEKARLTAEFFRTSFAMFRQSGDEYTVLLQQLADTPDKQNAQLLFVGLSDLTEIALMRALQAKLPVIGIYQPGFTRKDFFGVPVLTMMPDVSSFDIAVMTSMEQTPELLAQCEQILPSSEILLPPMLLTMKFRNAEIPDPQADKVLGQKDKPKDKPENAGERLKGLRNTAN